MRLLSNAFGMESVRAVAVVLLSVVLGSSCAVTRQTRSVEQSGFLGDYGMLHKGEGDEAQLLFIDPQAPWERYDAVLLDSVTLWHSGEAKLSEEDQQVLTDHMYTALHDQLVAKGFQIVSAPAANAIRLRAAITEARGARTVANAVTSIVPQTRLIASLHGLTSDTAIFVGKAGLEMEVTDSLSGRRLAAAVDARIGQKTVQGAFGKWKQVESALDYWAERTATRLADLHAGR